MYQFNNKINYKVRGSDGKARREFIERNKKYLYIMCGFEIKFIF